MKKVFSLIILALAMPFVFAGDVELGGQHRARAVYYNGNDNFSDVFVQYFKLEGIFRSNEMFESRFWLLTNYKWGDNDYTDNDVRIYAYGDWKMSDEWMLRLGRVPFSVADGNSIGLNSYDPFPYVLDGVFVEYNTQSIELGLFVAHLPRVWVGEKEEVSPHEAVAGVSLGVMALPEVVKMANLYAMYVMIRNSDEHNIRVGTSLGGGMAMAEYKFSGALHGPLSKLDQWYANLELAYTFDFNVRVYGAGHYETDEYDPFYYSRHPEAGLADIVQWGLGTRYAEVGLGYVFPQDIELGVAGVYFQKVGQWGVWGNAGVHPSELESQLKSEDVFEADVYIQKNYMGGFSIKLATGIFDVAGDKPAIQAQLNTKFDF